MSAKKERIRVAELRPWSVGRMQTLAREIRDFMSNWSDPQTRKTLDDAAFAVEDLARYHSATANRIEREKQNRRTLAWRHAR